MREQPGLTALIHDTPFDPALWDDVLCQLVDKIGAESAVMTTLDIVSGAGTGLPVRQDPAVMNDYFTHWATQNPLQLVDDPVAYLRGWRPTIMRDGDWMKRDALCTTAYFNEFLHPIGADHSIFIRLGLEGKMLSAISIARPDHRGGFQSREIAIARRYQGHMVQAVRTARRVRLSQEALDHLDALLATTDQALLFLDRRGRVRRISAAAERLLFDHGPLRLVDGRLELRSAAKNGALRALIDRARSGTLVEGTSLSLDLPGSGRRVTLSISPLGHRGRAALSDDVLILSAVEEPVREVAPTRDLDIRMRFGLTGAEARVALAIADGDNLRQFADRSGVSIHTVRAQLGAVFAKTATRRQADLVRLLLGNANA